MRVKAPVSAELLRALFNEIKIWEKLERELIFVRLYWQGKATPRHLPTGSLSQLWDYLTPEGIVFARAHQYQGPDGKPLGLPDPKYFLMGEIEFYIGQDP